MISAIRPIAAAAAGLLLSTCVADKQEQRASADLCRFGERKKPVLMGYIDKTGAGYLGEIPVKDYDKLPRIVSSAVAAPRSPLYRLRVPKDCYNKKGDYYYSCPKVVAVDLTKVRGIGRAPTIVSANRLAVRLCQYQTQALATKQTGYSKASAGLTCRIVDTRSCALDMARFERLNKGKAGVKKD